MSRIPLDAWSKREQLCLASAVSCSGDQNWITVSRTLKSVCGNNGNTRPSDWYSQKNCAVQYGHLLETVETTKRKKRTNENSGFSSPATVAVETPTELLLRRLTEERLVEIKAQMRRDQELYCKMQREIEALQSDETTEEQLQQMWHEIEKEQETKRIDEMKLENRMREREQRKKDAPSNWRSNSGSRRSNMTADTTAVDMDVEDIGIIPAAGNAKQQSVPAPLLTSLLITSGGGGNNAATTSTSTTAGTPTTTTPTPTLAGAGTGSVARATAAAPTITSLLTSGAGAIPNQPAVILKSPNDPEFMTRPISGPPVAEVAITRSSPSQAAPTLSMLLEKNKASTAAKANETTTTVKSTDAEATPSQKQPAADKESTDAAAAEDAVADEWEVEEKQLLEALSDIMEGVIDEDILKDVDNVVSPATAAAATDAPAKSDVDFEDKLDALKVRDENVDDRKSPSLPKPVEVVIGSSDDSNDNIPLAAVASQESSKERSQQSVDDEAAAEELNETITIASSSSEENNREATASTDETTAGKDAVAVAKETTTPETSTKETAETAQTQTADAKVEKVEPNNEAPKEDTNKSRTPEATDKPPADAKTPTPATAASSVHDTDEESSTQTDNSSKPDEPATRSHKAKQPAEHKLETETRQTPPRAASITVTPAAATPTAPAPAPVPVSTPTPAPAPVPTRAPMLRKLPHRDRSESPMVDDDATTTSDHSTTKSSSRRRCSSTPLIDSIPNSPASSDHTDDRRETRGASKKLFLSIYATLLESKNATYFRRAFHDEHPHKSADLCLRPMDLPTIKRNIDSGHLRSISELQRDVLLMCHNLLLIYKPQSAQRKTVRRFMQECRAIKEFAATAPTDNTAPHSITVAHKVEKERTPAGNKARSGSRKSQRHH
ncbi:bromodomain-containing protein 8 [Drosophila grimshawi]|uniref:GH14005 n=1 Tax=Drosophila grimshawi TaxID=7222 RepID=B4JYJ1_DROGR|nr:bromodomain-containing protein 8 [Drosophila grimshawi]EDV90753.1 GH14005 [Drosophila grimshawi]